MRRDRDRPVSAPAGGRGGGRGRVELEQRGAAPARDNPVRGLEVGLARERAQVAQTVRRQRERVAELVPVEEDGGG